MFNKMITTQITLVIAFFVGDIFAILQGPDAITAPINWNETIAWAFAEVFLISFAHYVIPGFTRMVQSPLYKGVALSLIAGIMAGVFFLSIDLYGAIFYIMFILACIGQMCIMYFFYLQKEEEIKYGHAA